MAGFMDGLRQAAQEMIGDNAPLLSRFTRDNFQSIAPTQASPEHDVAGAAEGGMTYVGANGLRADAVRRGYISQTATLPNDASEARTALKESARAATPAPQRAWLELTRPDRGAGPNSIGGAARTNLAATEAAAGMGRLGRASLLGSAVLGGLEIASSPNKPRAAAAVAGGTGGGWAGGVGGAEAGGLIGTAIEPGLGTLVGAAIGGVAGSMGGGVVGHRAGERLYDHFRGSYAR